MSGVWLGGGGGLRCGVVALRCEVVSRYPGVLPLLTLFGYVIFLSSSLLIFCCNARFIGPALHFVLFGAKSTL